jgi:hypothetical protein
MRHPHTSIAERVSAALTLVRQWVKRHPRWAIAVVVTAVLCVGAAAYAIILFTKPAPKPAAPSPPQKQAAPKPAPKYYFPLTGLLAPDEVSTQKPITGIIIENSPDARPQSGLAAAEVVYEAIAEGGITRFLALYQQEKPQLIGPVRSLRPYYVDWLTPYDASIAHVGGSRKALETVRGGGYRDLDQMLNADTYWRTRDRYAPHNVYTSFEKLDGLNAAKHYTSSHPKLIERTDPVKTPPTAPHINVTVSGPWYNSTWDYREADNIYTRSQSGAEHVDREAGQITANVVVVLKQTMDTAWEDGPREFYQTTGSGEAIVFQNGQAQAVTWHKASAAEQFSFTTPDGKPFPLARGKVWLTAVPVNEGGAVSW